MVYIKFCFFACFKLAQPTVGCVRTISLKQRRLWWGLVGQAWAWAGVLATVARQEGAAGMMTHWMAHSVEGVAGRSAAGAVMSLCLAVLLQRADAALVRNVADSRGRTELAQPGAIRRASDNVTDKVDDDKYAWIYAVGTKGSIARSRPCAQWKADDKDCATTGAGEQWEMLTSGVSADLHDVYFGDARNGLVVGASSTVLTTSTMGDSWDAVDLGLSQATELYGVFNLEVGGPVYVVGEKGLFAWSEDGEAWTAKALTCPDGHGKPCSETPFTGNSSNTLTIYGARFRDSANGVLVGRDGSVIIVRAGSNGREYILQKPVKVGNVWPNYKSIASDALGDFVVGGSLGVVLKLFPMSRKQDDSPNWDIHASFAAGSNQEPREKFKLAYRLTGDYDNGKTISENKTNTLFQVDETKSVMGISGRCKYTQDVAKWKDKSPEFEVQVGWKCDKDIFVTSTARGSSVHHASWDWKNDVGSYTEEWKYPKTATICDIAGPDVASGYMATENTLIVISRTGVICKSTDGGTTWKTNNDLKWPSTSTVLKMAGESAMTSL